MLCSVYSHFMGALKNTKYVTLPSTAAPLIQKIQLRKLMNRSEEMYLINYEAFIDKGLGGKGAAPLPHPHTPTHPTSTLLNKRYQSYLNQVCSSRNG